VAGGDFIRLAGRALGQFFDSTFERVAATLDLPSSGGSAVFMQAKGEQLPTLIAQRVPKTLLWNFALIDQRYCRGSRRAMPIDLRQIGIIFAASPSACGFFSEPFTVLDCEKSSLKLHPCIASSDCWASLSYAFC
jgi:hypothetical protein